MANTKEIAPRLYKPEFINEVLDFIKSGNSITKASFKFSVPPATLSKWKSKDDQGYKFVENKVRPKYWTGIAHKRSNKRYPNEYKKRVMESYIKYGFSATLKKFNELSETTFNRWIHLHRSGTLYSEKLVKYTLENKRPVTSTFALNYDTLVIYNNQISNDAIASKFRNLSKPEIFLLINRLSKAEATRQIPISYWCSVAGVTRQGFNNFVKRDGKDGRIKFDQLLVDFILKQYRDGHTYKGQRMLQAEFLRSPNGYVVSRAKVRRIMEYHNLSAVVKHSKTWRKINVSDVSVKIRKNLINCPCKIFAHLMKNPEEKKLGTLASNYVWYTDATFISYERSIIGKYKLISLIDGHDRSILAARITDASDHTNIFINLLQNAINEHGKPVVVHSDNGGEYINQRITKFYEDNGINASYIKEGEPWRNGIIERWHKTLKAMMTPYDRPTTVAELTNNIFKTLREYNSDRPHSVLKYQTPYEIRAKSLKMLETVCPIRVNFDSPCHCPKDDGENKKE